MRWIDEDNICHECLNLVNTSVLFTRAGDEPECIPVNTILCIHCLEEAIKLESKNQPTT